MKITPTEEQTILAESVSRFLADRADELAHNGGEGAFDPALWKDIADLGWLGAGVSDVAGGYGGGREMAIVMERAGHTPLAEQLVPAFMALAVLEAAAPDNRLIPVLLSGQNVACGLIPEMAERIEGRAEPGGKRISGRFRGLPLADEADHLVLAMPGLAVVLDPASAGIDRRTYRGLDGILRTDLTLDDVEVEQAAILAEGAVADAALQRARVFHAAAVTAACTGLATRLFEDTLAYVKQREQFGQPIARFQALQHRLADMFVALEEIRALSLAAARSAEEGGEAGRSLSQAVVGCIDRALHIAKEAIQLHGGVGMTEDLPLGAGLRRVKALQLMPAGAETHRQRLVAPVG